jgi:hypothetical protein
MSPQQQHETAGSGTAATASFQVGGLPVDLVPSRLALSDLGTEFRANPGEVCGLLLGSWVSAQGRARRVEVESCLTFGSPSRKPGWLAREMEALAELITAWGAAPELPSVIGFFASLGETDDAGALIHEIGPVRQSFPADGVVVIAGRLAGPEVQAAIVQPEQEAPARWLHFELIYEAARESAVAALVQPPDPPAAPPHVSVPESSPPQPPPAIREAPPPRRSAALLLTLASLCALVSLAGAGYVWMQSRSAAPQASNAPPSPQPAAREAAAPLGMQVTRRGGDLEISWNRAIQLVDTAQRGYLEIRDGARKTQVFLDQTHLKSGRVVYAPKSGDIDVRLEVLTPDDRIVRETLRVIQAGATEPAAAVRVEGSDAPPPTDLPQQRERQAEEGEPNAAGDTSGERRVFVPPAVRAASVPLGTARFEAAPPPISASAMPQQPVPLPPTLRRPAEEEPTTTPEPARRVATTEPWQPPVPTRQLRVPLPPSLRTLIVNPVDIEVVLSLDETGKVVRADVADQKNTLNGQLAALAKSTAQQWVFAPARRGGNPVPSSYSVVFRFRRQ